MKVKHLCLFMITLGAFILFCAFVSPGYAAEAAEGAAGGVSGVLNGTNKSVMALAAMGSVGISCITSAYALAKIGSAAMGTMGERPEVGGRALVFLGMAEGIAIYGLIISIMILNKI